MIDARAERTLRWVVAACLLALFVALGVLVHRHDAALDRLDLSWGREPHAFTLRHHGLAETLKVAAWVFWPTAWIVVMVLAGAFLWTKSYRRAACWTAGVSIATWVVAHLARLLVNRPRPHWAHPVQVLHDPSFPSIHAAQAASSAGIVIVLVTMLVRRRAVRRVVVGAAVLIATLVGVSRVYLGVHHPSDVVGGWLLGAGLVVLGLAVFDPAPRSIAIGAVPLPEVYVDEDRVLAVVLNPAKVDDPGHFRAMVEAMARQSGFGRVRWWETTVDDTGYRMAHEAAVSGARVVLAVGGDGTVRAVCEELAGTGIAVGIVPAGTGNLLARNLEIPLYLRAAVDVGLNGQDRAIDMVAVSGDEMEDATFLVMAGMGFDAAIMEGVNEDIKAKVGWLAYVWSALKSLMFPAIRVEVSVDDGPFTRHRARTIVIGNVGHLQAGMPLLPDAAIDDGNLDVVLLYPRRFLSWVPLAARVLTKSTRTDETIMRMSGRAVAVRTATVAPRQLDGDLVAPGRELRAECIHGRLLVRVPR